MISKTILLGHLGADPEVRYTPAGKAVANLRLATSKSWKDQQGQKQERTEWHQVVVWGQSADFAAQYLRKGALVYIEGENHTRQWQDDTGATRYTTEVVVKGYDGKLTLAHQHKDPTGATPPRG